MFEHTAKDFNVKNIVRKSWEGIMQKENAILLEQEAWNHFLKLEENIAQMGQGFIQF